MATETVMTDPKQGEQRYQGLLILAFIVGIFASPCIWLLQETTIIPYWATIGVYLAAGVGITALLYRPLSPLFSVNPPFMHMIAVYLCCQITFAGPLCLALLTANRYWANNESITRTVKIIQTGNYPKRRNAECSTPFAAIAIQGVYKEIAFPCQYEFSLYEHKSMQVTTRKGWFGIEVIIEKKLKE